jgi:hypothetical protein
MNLLDHDVDSHAWDCGSILGFVELVDCVQGSKSQWAEPGAWHWVVRNATLLKTPVPYRGQLGLWCIETIDMLTRLRALL